MTKKIIKELVLASYTQSALDPKKVEKIVRLLNRSMLKLYIKALKQKEAALSVSIDSVFPIHPQQKETLAGLFPEKKITYVIDPTLLAGLKVTKDDIIFEMSIKGALDTMLERIRNDYD